MILSPCPPPMLIFNGGNATDLIIRSDQPSKLSEGRGREEEGRGGCQPACNVQGNFIYCGNKSHF